MQKKRFKPDNDGEFPEWVEIEFGELFQRRSEKNGKEFGIEKTISVATMHFKPEGNNAADESLPKYKVMRKGDIAYEGHTNKDFRHGRFVLNDIGDGIISPVFDVLRPVCDLSSEVPGFWKYYINYEPVMKKVLAKCANTGIMMNRLAINDFYKQKIKVPCIEEQQKIAHTLAAFDEMIAVKTKKMETYQELKKTMLKNIFGRTKRFKADDGSEFPEWEEKTLGEVAEIKKGKGYTKKDLSDTGVPIVLYGRLYTKYETTIKNIDTFAIKKRNSLLSVGGEVLIPTSGENSEDIARAAALEQQGALIGGDLCIVMPNPDMFDSTFLAYTITYSKSHKELVKKSNGEIIAHLRVEDIRNLSVSLPCIDEQRKISSFLSEIDNMIRIQKEFIKTYADGKRVMMRELLDDSRSAI